MPQDGLHLNQVNHTLEVFFGADRNHYRNRLCAQHFLHLANHLEEVCTRTVHLIHVTDTWNIVLISLAPYGLRLRLHTTNGTICCNSTVKHTKRAFHLCGEVHVSRSINQIELILVAVPSPICSCGCRSNRDTTFLLLCHPVHCCGTIMNLAQLMSFTCVEQDTLRCGSFTSIDVSHDAKVTCKMQILLCHTLFSFLPFLP